MARFLYIHIPFCERKCLYCDFFSVPGDASLMTAYTGALCRELERKRHLAAPLKAVFLGGGTPTILPSADLAALLACISRNYSLAANAEVTVEANPGSMNREKLLTLLTGGVNRISLGIQSFRDEELKLLGRIHDAAAARDSVRLIRAEGLGNLSIDLMYALPGQSLQNWQYSLEEAIALEPDHISAYELTPEKKTPLAAALASGALRMPEEELIITMADLAAHLLQKAGYEQYEISNYSRPGFRCLHNMNYWNRGPYLAAGAGAHAFIGSARTAIRPDLKSYIERSGRGLDPEEDVTILSREDELKEFIFLGLRKTEGLNLCEAQAAGLDLVHAAEELRGMGLIEQTETHLRLSRKGLHLTNSVILHLLEGLGL